MYLFNMWDKDVDNSFTQSAPRIGQIEESTNQSIQIYVLYFTRNIFEHVIVMSRLSVIWSLFSRIQVKVCVKSSLVKFRKWYNRIGAIYI